ncbi:hypothetical protein [Pseudomonas sp. PSE14]|uniref:hypothetical protein n=1 Tax=Pseudomonas sp. PSE14 TaxID=3016341 RepID=UPI0023D8655D|nr:hypothetical protein [Pseudomonas sp. PSE14]WEJ73075.1 hypothetical protein O6P39_04065 [Pseudomonas sp. PSE14]
MSGNKLINIIKYVFAAVGLLLLIGAVFIYGRTQEAMSVAVLVILGVVFLAIGGGIILAGRWKAARIAYLQQNGVLVSADFQSVEINQSVSVNGRNPYVIVCQWLNKETSELHLFESDNIWFDPSDYIERDTIEVLVDRGNPSKYHVDISFLPRLAN